ncbi:unnamed protein product [Phyllotreta striolata]|uniref:Cytochrome P450 n=1 Tax=Phyllotreta striolata TaxID=444603 RepID=A0A9N9XQM0_PHYSR|nr:unnamed protein product [Phyllotreta striolata]
MFLVLLLILAITLFYLIGVKPLLLWKNKGVPQKNFLETLFMNYFSFFIGRSIIDFIKDVYQAFPGCRYHGIYQFNRDILVIKDADLIKQLLVKDYEHFNEHRDFISEDVDPLLGKSLFLLKGNEWRTMRTALSPAFTSSKMKLLFLLMLENTEKCTNFLLKKRENLIEIEMKDFSSRFCSDVIASCAFGTEVDSFKNPDNEFFRYGKEFIDLKKFSRLLRFLICFLLPRVSKMFNIKVTTDEINDFFSNLIENTIKLREEKGIVRPDIVHLLMEARKGNLTTEETVEIDTGYATVEEHLKGSVGCQITNKDIISQAFLFFFAGFDAVSTLICFMAYELCINGDIQDRLREEISQTSEDCNDKLSYEALVKMRYLDMVVTEALRKWPTQVMYERICMKPYTIEPVLPHEKPVDLDIGQTIFIPVYGVHHDPELFPDPEAFDPERFSDENKNNIKSSAFQPFGLGPRNCIGSRFALLETKILFFFLLKHFKIVPVEKTEIPLKHGKNMFSPLPTNGFWMGLERIQKN